MYHVVVDPLDGANNADAGVSVGSTGPAGPHSPVGSCHSSLRRRASRLAALTASRHCFAARSELNVTKARPVQRWPAPHWRATSAAEAFRERDT